MDRIGKKSRPARSVHRTIDAVIEVFGQHGDREQRELIAEGEHSPLFNQICVAIINGDHPVSVTRWAYEAVAGRPGIQNGRLARQGLQSDAMTIRLHSLIGIASGRVQGRIDWLFDLLDDESGGIRVNALEALIDLRPQRIHKELPRMAGDPKRYVQRVAHRAMRADAPGATAGSGGSGHEGSPSRRA